jgi:hypothetical protein
MFGWFGWRRRSTHASNILPVGYEFENDRAAIS